MLRRTLIAFLCLALLVSPARATWSIVVVNRRTGEVGVAGATCIENVYLIGRLPVALPGIGGGVIQSAGAFQDLVPMAQGLRAGLPPADIMELVKIAEPNPNTLQAAVVALYPGAPVSFTGPGCGVARASRAGEVGDLAYAVQGNVLTGIPVVTSAENALINTRGDLGQKLMAAMEVARALGGDGRCSCIAGPRANSCGCPPPSFRKSAHGSFVLVARMGDVQPPCAVGNDCQDASYYLSLVVRGDRNDPDPVLELQTAYDGWRAGRAGRPDGLRSTISPVAALPADGVTERVVTVQLVDVDGVPLTHGGADVRVLSVDGAQLNTLPGPVTDLGDGRYRFTLTATRRSGTERLVVPAKDDLVSATLYPYLKVESQHPERLHAGFEELSAGAGGELPFVLSVPELPGGAYLVLASASGSVPATPAGRGLWLPLARDSWFELSKRLAGQASFLPGTRGVLDATGRAEASMLAPPGALVPLIGRKLTWAAVVTARAGALTTAAVDVEVVP